VDLQLEEPEGTVRITLARDLREVAIQVDSPAALVGTVRDAEAPIRHAVEASGHALGTFEVRCGGSGVGEPSGQARAEEHAGRRQAGARAARNRGRAQGPAGPRGAGVARLLDRKA
jgi:hypothetical protein